MYSDSCAGDSGGPLMQVLQGDYGPRYYLSGIVSIGDPICGAGPAIYTRISSYLHFILESMSQNE